MPGPHFVRRLDDAVQRRLEKYVNLLGRWRNITNLISEDSFADIWQRHIFDGIQLQQLTPNTKCWLDIGSGAGLPSAIIACLLADVPDAQVHCVEIDRRKCSFLREVAFQLQIPLKIHNVPADTLNRTNMPGIEAVTAQAFATIERILLIAEPFLSDEAIVILPRGRRGHDEVADLDHERYMVHILPNLSPGDGIFVRIEQRASHDL